MRGLRLVGWRSPGRVATLLHPSLRGCTGSPGQDRADRCGEPVPPRAMPARDQDPVRDVHPGRVDRDVQASSEEPTVTRPDRAASITAPTRLLTPSLP